MRKQQPGQTRAIKREHLGFDYESQEILASYTYRSEEEAGGPVTRPDLSNMADAIKAAQLASRPTLDQLKRVVDAERIAFYNAFSCEINGDTTVRVNDALSAFHFDTVNLNAETVIVRPSQGGTVFRASRRTQGIYRFSAMIWLAHPAPLGVDSVHGFFAVNGQCLRAMPVETPKRTGDGAGGAILTSITAGTAILAVRAGDEVSVVLDIDNGGVPAGIVYGFDSSIYGHFDGERLSCEIDELEPMRLIASANLPTYL